ncbi:methyltransferase domain-containing protein [Patescibacteria group bacterium AH-259-L07]|nr:methyltransferase domain-containing protein [Patescibacteria group bacterium AH-259-L07]
MTYFFILGNNPTLSIAEIVCVLSAKIKKQNIKVISQDVFIVEFNKKIDISLLQKQLGGTIKIGKIISTRNIDDIKRVEQSLVKQILLLFPLNVKKVFFGFSIYGGRVDIKALALAIKEKLKQQGIASRWVVSKESVLSSVVVQKNKLLEQGAEFTLFIKKDKVLLGKTLTCQEFEKYSFYDFSRPYRAIEKGMMPPKLAKMMINLSGTDSASVFLDPFCGSGTILQQAILMGYENVIGVDVDEHAVSRTQKNLEWLTKNEELRIKNEELSVKIQKCDVKNLDKKIPPQSVDTIITEPYLGPLKIRNLKAEIKILSDLYINAFKSFKKVLKPDGRVVIIFPVFSVSFPSSSHLPLSSLGRSPRDGRTKNKLHFLLILDTLKKIGWQTQIPLPQYLLDNPVIKTTSRRSIIYSRPDQKILREILIFTRT